MKTYNVLSREQSVHQHAILEASAGTGKTFTIENIVSRLITESGSFEEPLTIDKILVVTFTRAATRELKDRIRNKLVTNLALLKSGSSDIAPDYLKAHMDMGPQAIKKAIGHIEQALTAFDFAQIFTIHGFCWRMLKNHALEAHIGLEATSKEEKSMDTARLQRAVRDFLRNGLKMPAYTLEQLKILKNDQLAEDLLKEVSKGIDIIPPAIDDSTKSSIFCRAAADCQQFLKHFLDQEEMIGHNDLLTKMLNAINNATFANKVRQLYSAVIVDEFQDTDPVQWEIFSRLFADEQSAWKGFITLVGDPKQSIYAFRQADIYTYLSAANKFGPEAHATLNTNYRSVPSLVDAINALFKSSEGMFTLPRLSFELPYPEVKAGISSPETLEPCLQFWSVEIEGKAKRSSNKIDDDYFFPAIADEILRLKIAEETPLSFHAVLVSTNYQAKRLTSYLKGRGIAVKAYRGSDLSNSPAAHSLRELLNGILNYRSESLLKIALSGKMIGMTSSELSALDDEEHLVSVLTQCEALRSTLQTHGFAVFYQQFLQTSWHEDKKSVLERLLLTSDGYDFYRQWQDLADLLIQDEQNLLPFGLLSYLDDLITSSQEDEEYLQSYVDLEKDGVSILTTFVSKGLEFEIVYALGLARAFKLSTDDLFPVHDGTKYHLSAAKDINDPTYRAHCEETDAEKIRSLYVALTRAKHKLYVPIILNKNRKIPIGTASPTDILLAKIKSPSCSYSDLYRAIELEDGSTLKSLTEKYPTLMRLKTLSAMGNNEGIALPLKTMTLIPPPTVIIPTYEKFIQSYSSLVISKAHPPENNEISPPHDFTANEKNEHSLPSGNEIGILLHSIFETLPFPIAKDYKDCVAFMDVISPYINKTPFTHWKEVISRIVFNALKTPLPGESFCLADVHPDNTYRETEFLFPYDPESLKFDTVKIKPGFLKGVIDLFFKHEDKYYLVDWKSNWLGPSQDSYGQQSLKEAMHTNSYDIQAAVYMRAMKRYLQLFDSRPFKHVFGGTYYIFLRGVGTNTGVLHLDGGDLC